MTRLLAIFLVAAALSLTACGGEGSTPTSAAAPSGNMILATTTSTRDSGLLDVLIPAYERSSSCTVKTVAVGSGQALALGARGDADVLLVHSPAAEREFVAAGHAASRDYVMSNDFVLVGPPSDPAHIAGQPTIDAFRRIAEAKAPFASRADESGTNAKELELWKAAGVTPAGGWYVKTGQGMGETLQIASQKQAYTLADTSTMTATPNLDLKVLGHGGTDLANPYHVMVVRHDGTNRACAQQFADWILSPSTQRLIGSYGKERFGEPLFRLSRT
jgi:tungstate transport system substrate-binding protein